MKLQFCGANREVTGSCHLLIVKDMRILVDCGMFQGSDFSAGKNYDDFPFDPKDIDVLLVTHAHLDHVGRIPKLVREGFSGPIYMTRATVDLAPFIWEDAHSIMSYDKEKFGYPVLFDQDDISQAKALCKGVEYHQELDIGNGITAVWKEAGHIFGSAFIEVIAEGKKIGFSGDIGNEDVPILKDTEALGAMDILITETTYGDRIHEQVGTRKKIILDAITRGVARGGTVMVPAFSLERTQELLYELNTLAEYDKTLPSVPVFLDSPLAIDTTKVFKKYYEYYDDEAMRQHRSGDDFLDFPNLHITYTKMDSMKLNSMRGAKVIIAGAGMMNGGRIQHHALRYLANPDSTLLFVGYQARGTVGRAILDGAKRVTIMRQEVDVRCAVEYVSALSGHGDQKKLLSWTSSAQDSLRHIFCVHGEEQTAETYADILRDRFSAEVHVPEYGSVVDLS